MFAMELSRDGRQYQITPKTLRDCVALCEQLVNQRVEQAQEEQRRRAGALRTIGYVERHQEEVQAQLSATLLEQQSKAEAMEDIDALKSRTEGPPRYKLSGANVFVSSEGYHYIDYLDPVEEFSPEIDASKLTETDVSYIERSLQSNPERFDNQVNALERYLSLEGKRVLDIGCGGGLFLSRIKAEGAKVNGIELNDSRAQYAASKYGLEIVKWTIESEYWQEAEPFDAVTLWDVIEHVNYPLSTLKAAAGLRAVTTAWSTWCSANVAWSCILVLILSMEMQIKYSGMKSRPRL